ncbi:MAG: hypothetical protein C5B56_06245 [Proteobacteria bacterium]|nr:MAG: hypothetical protein C5B56_06245 [Pseudomonadota bacterium]
MKLTSATRLRAWQDLSAGLMFAGFGAIFALGAGQYSIGTLDEMGPGFLPLCVGILLALIGVLLIAKSLIAGGDAIAEFSTPPLLLIAASICVFALIFPYFGLVTAIFVLTVIAARASPEFRLSEALCLGALLAALSAGVFIYGLGIPLPAWPTIRL